MGGGQGRGYADSPCRCLLVCLAVGAVAQVPRVCYVTAASMLHSLPEPESYPDACTPR